jgi:lambda family phage portal protein
MATIQATSNRQNDSARTLNFLDKAIAYFAPVYATKRVRARAFIGALTETGYVSFASRRPSMRAAFASGSSANQDFLYKQASIRASCRDLSMNTPLASGILRRCRTNIVGYGLRFHPRIDREFLELTEDQADAWRKDTARRFNMWAESKNCDASRSQNFYEIQALTCFSQLLSGDVFVMMHDKPRESWPYRLCLRVLESDRVNTPLANVLDTKNQGGVEVDESGEAVAYYVQRSHPGDANPILLWDRVPAYGPFGLPNILHNYDKERPDARRGVPMLATVIEPLKQLTRLSESELMAAVVTSMYTVFIKQNSVASNPLADGFAVSEKVTAPDTSEEDRNLYELGSGSIVGLGENEDVTFADPKRPNGLYEPFFKAIVKQIGCSTGFPAEMIMLAFEGSYSSARAVMLQAWKFIQERRFALGWDLCGPVYERWLFEEVLAGRIECKGFLDAPEIRAAWSGSAWVGPGMGQINPEVETAAAISRITANLSTHSKEVAGFDGDSWEDMIPQRIRENRIIVDNELDRDLNVTQTKIEAVQPPVPPESQDADKDDADKGGDSDPAPAVRPVPANDREGDGNDD